MNIESYSRKESGEKKCHMNVNVSAVEPGVFSSFRDWIHTLAMSLPQAGNFGNSWVSFFNNKTHDGTKHGITDEIIPIFDMHKDTKICLFTSCTKLKMLPFFLRFSYFRCMDKINKGLWNPCPLHLFWFELLPFFFLLCLKCPFGSTKIFFFPLLILTFSI